ncbi:MAG: aldo/keto reductase [Chloroflexi bacterium]|nr:aldo/keto reductase [Chloroflexota bacterium]
MNKRKIGKSNVLVTPLCLGGNVFGWTIDHDRSFEVLDAFVAGGGNFIDTADVYSTWAPGNAGGESESIVGAWMRARGNRDRVVIATKLGSKMSEGREGLGARYMVEAVEASLRRLQTDVIDLYQAHIDDESTLLEETLAAFDKLVQQGKVRAIGASNYSGARLRAALDISAAHDLARYDCLQPNYNYIDREPYERDLRPLCLERQVGVIPYFSLARGFLSGKYKPGAELPQTARAGGVQKSYFNEAGWAALAKVERAAAELNARPSQVALAWLMAQPDITAPIASATTAAQADELLGALRLDGVRVVEMLS